MKQVGVDCRFMADGTVVVQRITIDKTWVPVEQGRQWVDREGRHVLVMLPDSQPRQLRLRPDTMTWELRPVGGPDIKVV